MEKGRKQMMMITGVFLMIAVIAVSALVIEKQAEKYTEDCIRCSETIDICYLGDKRVPCCEEYDRVDQEFCINTIDICK